jgi:hypothetical protein
MMGQGPRISEQVDLEDKNNQTLKTGNGETEWTVGQEHGSESLSMRTFLRRQSDVCMEEWFETCRRASPGRLLISIASHRSCVFYRVSYDINLFPSIRVSQVAAHLAKKSKRTEEWLMWEQGDGIVV